MIMFGLRNLAKQAQPTAGRQRADAGILPAPGTMQYESTGTLVRQLDFRQRSQCERWVHRKGRGRWGHVKQLRYVVTILGAALCSLSGASINRRLRGGPSARIGPFGPEHFPLLV